MSTAGVGRAHEYAVRDDLIRHGWRFIVRSAASKGAADLVMAQPRRGLLALVQVGTRSKRLGPDDRARLVQTAAWCPNGLPILATWTPRQPITYHRVTLDPPSTWKEWQP